MKDNFSNIAPSYARFRPTYPQELIDFIIKQVNIREAAWDCATGNGQVAAIIANDFEKVFATDISAQQIEQAVNKENIFYSVQPAEQTNFSDNQFDLITVAQAIHWFNFNAFYAEVNRTLKRGGVIAVIGYSLVKTEGQLNKIIKQFYTGTIGKYWDIERRYIDELYQTIPFPFEEIQCPSFMIEYKWTLEQLTGYIRTWSAVSHFEKENQHDPLKEVMNDIVNNWGSNKTRKFSFPLLLRVGRKSV